MIEMRRLVPGVLCSLLLTGCALAPYGQHVATYVAPTIRAESPARIVVVPFDGRGCAPEERQLVTDAVAVELQSALLADVIPASPRDERLVGEVGFWQRGSVDIEVLVEGRRKYGADAFLFGTVTQYKPYDPPLIGLKLRMLSAKTGDVLWASEAVFDAHDRGVRRRATETVGVQGPKTWLARKEMVFMSPRYFARFVAQEVVRPLCQRLAPSPVKTVADASNAKR